MKNQTAYDPDPFSILTHPYLPACEGVQAEYEISLMKIAVAKIDSWCHDSVQPVTEEAVCQCGN